MPSAALHGAVAAYLAPDGWLHPGAVVSLSKAVGGRPLSVRVAPASNAVPAWVSRPLPVAVFCVADPDLTVAPPTNELRARFGLTRAQSALAAEILHGDGIQAAAERLSITRATARGHLAQIFEKTGTQRQSELVRLLLSSGFSGIVSSK